MAKSKKQLHEALRIQYLTSIIEHFEGKDEQVLRSGSNEVSIPCVDEEGNDEYIVITVKVPTGGRDGEAYDGYAMAEDYAIKVRQQAEKAEKAKAEKAKKIARDEAMRKQKAEAKARREAEGE